jgi:hypothetical protein
VFVLSLFILTHSAQTSAADLKQETESESPATLNEVSLNAKLTHLPPSPENPESKISGLTLDAPENLVRIKESPRSVILQGVFKPTSPDTKLVCAYSYDGHPQTPQIELDTENRFSLSIPLQEDSVSFELKAIDRLGHVASESFRVDAPASLQTPRKSATHSWSFTPALGISHLAYTETRIQPYSAILPTPKLGISYALSEQWSLGASAFMNLASLASSDPAVSVRFLGLNARAGFSFPTGSSSWKTTALLGIYSLGMNASNNALGFDRLYGPQFVLAERKTLDAINALTAYAKYSALLDGSDISLGKRELAGGASYERRIGERAYTASLDASVFDFNIGNIQIQSQTLTFGLGMGL